MRTPQAVTEGTEQAGGWRRGATRESRAKRAYVREIEANPALEQQPRESGTKHALSPGLGRQRYHVPL